MKKEKLASMMPLMFTVIGLGLILGISIYRLLQISVTEKVLWMGAIVLYLGWVFLEMRISVGELEKGEAIHDHHTMELCAVIKICMISVALFWTTSLPVPRFFCGVVVMLSGVFLRTLAIKKLGLIYTHRIRQITKGLMVEGPYRLVRHPAYLGTLIAHTGFVIIFFHIYSLIGLTFWYLAVYIRTMTEEKLHKTNLEYQAYARQVRFRLLPGIW